MKSFKNLQEELADYSVNIHHTHPDGKKETFNYKVSKATNERHAKRIAMQKHEKRNIPYHNFGASQQDVTKMSESKNQDLPFTPDEPKKNPSAKAGKFGLGYSVAKHLARQAMKKVQKEEVEELDELKASTLQSYSNKANQQAQDAEYDAAHERNKEEKKKMQFKAQKRAGGVERAQSKLDKIKESTAHKILATKLGNMERMKNVEIPTPAERRAQLEKQKQDQTKKEETMFSFSDFIKEEEQIDEAYRLPSDSEISKVKAHVKANHPNKSLAQIAVHKATKKIEYVVKDKDGKMTGHTLGESVESLDEISKELASKYWNANYNEKRPGASDIGLSKDQMRKIHNRTIGRNRALDRMYKKEEVEIEEVTSPMQKLRDAHDRHMEKALAANKAGDDEATKVHQKYMQKIQAKMQKLKQNEEIDLNEMESLCEISKATLGSYVKQAAKDRGFAGIEVGALGAKSSLERMKKRQAGIEKATNKLTKEEVKQVDELNKSTLASYAKKSHDQLMKHTSTVNYKSGRGDADAFSYEHDKDNMRKTANRTKGHDQAISKLAKEETINEATVESKDGIHRGHTVANYYDKREADDHAAILNKEPKSLAKEETEDQKKAKDDLDLKLKKWRQQQRVDKAIADQEKRLRQEETLDEVRAGDDVTSVKQKMAKTGKMSIKDKLLSIPRGFKAARAGKSEVDANLKEETEVITFKQLMENISEAAIDDLKDRIAARKATQSAYDKDYKPASKSNVTKVKGHSYGAGEEEGDDEDGKKVIKKPSEPVVKRGRGRPAGSKSGARN